MVSKKTPQHSKCSRFIWVFSCIFEDVSFEFMFHDFPDFFHVFSIIFQVVSIMFQLFFHHFPGFFPIIVQHFPGLFPSFFMVFPSFPRLFHPSTWMSCREVSTWRRHASSETTSKSNAARRKHGHPRGIHPPWLKSGKNTGVGKCPILGILDITL